MGDRARQVFHAEAGATARAVDALLALLAGDGRLSRAYLAPLSAIYGAAVATKNLAYENRWLTAKLCWPVVSIGNLSVGGSGKTPLTIRLAELLTAEGIAVDVLSRGYGRTSPLTERVDPSGDAERFGDEPLLIARRTGVPVFVGASRYQAGLLAEAASDQDPTESSAWAMFIFWTTASSIANSPAMWISSSSTAATSPRDYFPPDAFANRSPQCAARISSPSAKRTLTWSRACIG